MVVNGNKAEVKIQRAPRCTARPLGKPPQIFPSVLQFISFVLLSLFCVRQKVLSLICALVVDYRGAYITCLKPTEIAAKVGQYYSFDKHDIG